MFIYSMRASTIKFFGIVCVALAALVALIAFVPAYASGNTGAGSGDFQNTGVQVGSGGAETSQPVSIKYEKVKSADDAAGFLGQFGWIVDAGSAETVTVTIPAEFDKIFAGYNEMQKAQSLDLSKYKKKEVTRYTFKVTNYGEHNGKAYTMPVYANVLVYRNRVIGGDICSADVSGFIHGFEKPNAS
ncbi:MAG: DUF4830 domain-containing protein [Ruminococcaceae bacterium]|nr:DUF4830 domain-containing protein [Oscillospiraceae bacterium]